MMQSGGPTTVRQYGGRRLYHPDAGVYVTIGKRATMVEDDEGFVVLQAETGENITRSTLKQIIVERGSHG